MSIYDFHVQSNNGQKVPLSMYKGKVLLIVNTASKCGLTPQYEQLEQLYKKLGNDRFEILAFPCNQFGNQEPGENEEIQSFCQLNYGVSFPVFAKIDVNGVQADPLYQYLRESSSGILGDGIKWNFTKFLIDTEGKIVGRYAPTTAPMKMESKIKELMKQ